MSLEFWKMNGAGNDFVVVDNRDSRLSLTREQIALLCHRQRGIGADGLLALEPAREGADLRMRYYNADGGEAEMCGNGARCFARMARRLLQDGPNEISFETQAGVVRATFRGDQVRIGLSKPFNLALGKELKVLDQKLLIHSVNTGVPHAVFLAPDVDPVDIFQLGRAIRFHPHFAPAGTNANVMQATGPSKIRIRTYERGVEAETLACGTGMVASALIHHEMTGEPSPITVRVQGGDDLVVEFEKTKDGYEKVFLTGPADFVFQGTTDLV